MAGEPRLDGGGGAGGGVGWGVGDAAGDRKVGCGRGRERRGGEKFETEEGEKCEMDGEEVGKGNLPCVLRREGSAGLCMSRPVSNRTIVMEDFNLFFYNMVPRFISAHSFE